MNLHILKPKKALNKAFLKIKPIRSEIELFKENLTDLLDNSNDKESEEFHKNLVSDFLKRTYYEPDYFINTKGRNDLVIHNGNKAKSPVGVILEAKKPTNSGEMMSVGKTNTKAMQELVLYYLRERITGKNLEVKKLIITNIYEWFIFDANDFEKHFAQNKALVKQFVDFENGSLSGTSTDFFYKEIAAPVIAAIKEEVECTHFDFRHYEKPLRNTDLKDDVKLVALFKLLSPEHLLKKPFTNDSNSLDKKFYSELLHIIGLSEQKDGGKKIIERNPPKERNSGSLLEDAIIQIDSMDKLSRLDRPSQFGKTQEERLFNVGLELAITWINRILFLKLLEAQLIAYHEGDKKYAFLNFKRIQSYDDLNSLFFQVLAKKHDERNADVLKAFEYVPYLNSSLFEPTEIEHNALFISNLRDDKTLPILDRTVLKDAKGKRRTGEIPTLQYLFDFLNAYDFSGEGSENIQEDNKTLINASVLGLIFEKINGYKDGSFFTPGFITMYMCRETIRKAVVQKFNETAINIAKGNPTPPLEGGRGEDSSSINEKYQDITDIYNSIGSRGDFSHQQANDLINDIKICDPAVGSGHFLVSALNEMIAVKHDLGVLHDRQGKLLRDYDVHVENDELIITDYNGELFDYHPHNKESQRVQETLFHEKQTIIENCLFGVDINSNSVKICRLRLWIELLKNAYYISPADSEAIGISPSGSENKREDIPQLQTLPNIDINIKCGNSLISRFDLDADLGIALRKSKWNMDGYRIAVQTYRNAEDKTQKHEMERLIADIKGDFKTEISRNSKEQRTYDKLSAELYEKHMSPKLFEEELSRAAKSKLKKDREKLETKVIKLKEKLDEIKDNKIYENAFEWRFEFPEVLDDDGGFVGFDVVIGNPPYIRQEEFTEIKPNLKERFKSFKSTADLYVYFIDLGINILSQNGKFAYIIPNKWLRAGYGENLRKTLIKLQIKSLIDFGDLNVFEEATTYPSILELSNDFSNADFHVTTVDSLDFENGLKEYVVDNRILIDKEAMSDGNWNLLDKTKSLLINKIKSKSLLIHELENDLIFRGIVTGLNEAFIIDEDTKKELISKDEKALDLIKPYLSGRDIKRYEQPVGDKYIILARRGVEIDKYPSIYEHLLRHKAKLEKKAGSGRWYELQASPKDSSKFEQTKIMYPDISKNANFILDEKGYYSVNTVYNISSSSKGLLGYLNSKVFLFYFQSVSNSIRGGYLRFFTSYMKNAPIPEDTNILEPLVDDIITAKQLDPSADTSELEKEIDILVYRLYGLTYEEVRVVDEEFWMSEEEYLNYGGYE